MKFNGNSIILHRQRYITLIDKFQLSTEALGIFYKSQFFFYEIYNNVGMANWEKQPKQERDDER